MDSVQWHAKKLNLFYTTSLRKCLAIKWQDNAPDTEVLIHANLFSIHAILVQLQLRTAGHIVYKSDHCLPKRPKTTAGQVFPRMPEAKKCFKNTLTGSLKDFNINHDHWYGTAWTGQAGAPPSTKAHFCVRTSVCRWLMRKEKVQAIPHDDWLENNIMFQSF